MTLWREIGETLVEEIDQGVLAPGARLPADEDLAARFGVNRHTIRRALTHLQSEGLVRSEQGRGTFVVEDVISFRLAARTYLEENLNRENKVAVRTILSVAELFAPESIARELEIAPGDRVLLVTSVGEASGVPVHVNGMYFPLGRLPAIGDAFRAHKGSSSDKISTTSILKSVGVQDIRRRNVRIRCRLPTQQEAKKLKMASSEPVFETEITNVDQSGVPVFFAISSYPGSRIEFVMDF